MIGQIISRYRIIEKLGEGGMGVVYRAEDTRLDRAVALKFLSAHLLESEEARGRFVHEAKAAAALDHPNICTVYEIDEADGQTFLSMAFIEGETLKQKIAQRPLKVDLALQIAVQIAAGLAAAHERGIHHRDIKPANLMVGTDGVVKITDFGLAYLSGKSRITKTGTILGTPSYMAPEQIRGERTDLRADIWAFGVVLYEMLTGRLPFEGDNEQAIGYAILHLEPEPLTALRSGLPIDLDRIAAKCLAKDPAHRYQHIDDALVDLRTVSTQLPTAETRRTRSVRRVRRPGVVWIVAAVLPLALALLVIYRLAAFEDPTASHRFTPFATESYGEKNPVWSPDGRSIAYVARVDGKDQIMTRGIDAASPFRIAQCPAICDVVGWSGDGSRVYYQARTDLLNARLWSAARSGGAAAPVFEDGFSVLASAVSPDGQRLAMVQVFLNEKGAQMARLAISQPPGAAPDVIDGFPVVTLVQPHYIAWFADSDRVLVASPTGGGRMYLVSASNRTVRQVAAGFSFLRGLTWTQDARFALVATLPSPDRDPFQGNGLYWCDLETGGFSTFRLSELPISLPSAAPDGHRLAYTVAEGDLDVMEIPLDGSPVRPLLATLLPEHGARYSPLSDEFAYSTSARIRIRQPKSSAERVVVSRADFPAEAWTGSLLYPVFSPDGLRIAYNNRFKIWISPANGGQAVPLKDADGEFGAWSDADGEFGAEWSPDGNWIAYNWARPAGSGLFKRRVGATEPEVRLTEERCGAGPAWSPDGAWIACSLGSQGMALVPAEGGPPKLLGGPYEAHAVWSRDSDHLYLIRDSGGRREVGQLNWRTGLFQPLNVLPPDFVITQASQYAGRISLSYDGRALVATVLRATGDIWILDGLQPPKPPWKRILSRD